MIQTIKNFIFKNNEKIVMMLSGVLIIFLMCKIANIGDETKIINKLENYRQKVDVLDKDIERDINSLQNKLEQKKGIIQLMECELNQLIRLGDGLKIDNDYCSNNFSFIQKASADYQDPFEVQHNNWIQEEIDTQTIIRLERLEVCKEYLQESGLNIKEIYGQDLVLRCATFNTLVYAFESNFGVSRMCIEDKNCYGMKGNGKDVPAGNLKFDTFREGSEYFAKKYFQWHYKKDIQTFVHNWATGNRDEYIYFMESRFDGVYSELSSLYY